MDYVEKLELALGAINAAIGELVGVDGMSGYAEELDFIAIDIEEELNELKSVEGIE